MKSRLAPCGSTAAAHRAARTCVAAIALAIFAVVLLACASPAGAPERAPSAVATQGATASPMATAPGAATRTAVAAPPSPPVASATGAAAYPDSITISAVGDISLARQVVDRMQTNGPDYPYALIAPLIDGDIAIANLEGALTDRGEAWPKGYNFRTPPMFASGLADARFDVVSLANNHTMDYGAIGLLDTVGALDGAGVRHVGAGADAAAAHAPVIIEAKGMRVAFLGYVATPDESGGFSIAQWVAGAGTPGIAYASDDAIAADVAAARRDADFVVVIVHAGTEYRNAPDATQARIVNAVLAAGADAYIGAHAHVVQPIELRDGKLIAWGLGNFIFDLDSVDLANIPVPRVSLVLRFTLTKGAGVSSYDVLPVTQDADEDRPRLATPDEAAVLDQLVQP